MKVYSNFILTPVRETKTSIPNDSNEIIDRTAPARSRDEEDVVRAKLSNGPSSIRELQRNITLLVEVNIPEVVVVRGRGPSLGRQHSRKLLKHLEPRRVRKEAVLEDGVGPIEDVGGSSCSSVALHVLHEVDGVDTAHGSRGRWHKAQHPLTLNGCDRTLPSNTGGLRDSLRDETQLASGRHLSRGVEKVRVRSVKELLFRICSRKASIEAARTSVPWAASLNSLIRRAGLRSTSTTC